jgi:aldose 1-epimerase
MTMRANPLDDPNKATLVAGDLEAEFLPGFGMLGAGLRHKGAEILRRLDDLPALAAKGSTAGIPFLYPWANRLAATHYQKAGPEVTLDPASPLLHFDDNGLPIHGVPWSHLAWEVVNRSPAHVVSRLDWATPEQLAIFPYHHSLLMQAALAPQALTISIGVLAANGVVPVSFGFHPYLAIPDLPRSQWRLDLPAMRRLPLDARGIPTGAEEHAPAQTLAIGARTYDDGFALLGEQATLSISGAGRRICVELLEGFTHAQVYVPPGTEFVALEPMTAATNALISGDGLRLVVPGGEFVASFRIRVETID